MTEEQYKIDLQRFNQMYLRLVIGCAGCCALAIAVAVLAKVSFGIVIAVLTAMTYRTLLTKWLKKYLGLVCYRNTDGLTVSLADPIGTEKEIRIPSHLLWLDVTEVKDIKNVQILYLPVTVVRIRNLTPTDESGELRFEGNKDMWSAVEKEGFGMQWNVVCGNREESTS